MRLAIIENCALIREQLIRLLSESPHISIIGHAAEENAAVELVLNLDPDALILDLTLDSGSGLQMLGRIRRAGSRSRVLVLTNSASEAMRQACERHGIDGFFDKSHEVGDCLRLIRSWGSA